MEQRLRKMEALLRKVRTETTDIFLYSYVVNTRSCHRTLISPKNSILPWSRRAPLRQVLRRHKQLLYSNLHFLRRLHPPPLRSHSLNSQSIPRFPRTILWTVLCLEMTTMPYIMSYLME